MNAGPGQESSTRKINDLTLVYMGSAVRVTSSHMNSIRGLSKRTMRWLDIVVIILFAAILITLAGVAIKTTWMT